MDSNIGGPLPEGADVVDYLRNFDNVNYTLTFWGESYRLMQIMQEIRNLGPLAHKEGDPSSHLNVKGRSKTDACSYLR